MLRKLVSYGVAASLFGLFSLNPSSAATLLGTSPSFTGVSDLDIGTGLVDLTFVDVTSVNAIYNFNNTFGTEANYNNLPFDFASQAQALAVRDAFAALDVSLGGAITSFLDNVSYIFVFDTNSVSFSYYSYFTAIDLNGGPFINIGRINPLLSTVSFVLVSDFTPNSTVPLPAALPLLAGAIAGLGGLGAWRRRRAASRVS